MHKRVILKFGQGTFETGFPVTLQMGDENTSPTVEVVSHLPPAPDLSHSFYVWQAAYLSLGLPYRLEPKTGFAKNVSTLETCQILSQALLRQMNSWLMHASFRGIREKLLEQLNPNDTIRFLLQTEDPVLEHLPWHLLDFFERYPRAEVALCAPSYERLEAVPATRRKGCCMRILAVLGNSDGLDVSTDQALLQTLPQAEVEFLVEPDRQTLNSYLWDPQGWDILFFAGHSSSQITVAESSRRQVGFLHINPDDSLTMAQIRYALQGALRTGLKIAIFNSCDGLGLAHALADLRIPQVLVMREPIPDSVAQTFLKCFLEAYSRPESLYLAVREAREKLQGLEDRFPCATWLPVIYQNPAFIPPNWPGEPPTSLPAPLPSQLSPGPQPRRLRSALVGILLATMVVLGGRLLGGLQSLELSAYDQLLRLRPQEAPDDRITLITLDEADIDAQLERNEVGRGSLSDTSLENLLTILDQYPPRIIGLDIYRPFRVNPAHPDLARRFRNTSNLVFICKSSDGPNQGIAPPPEVPLGYVGFSDLVQDDDGVVRRHLVAITPEANSPCLSTYAFSAHIALRYLNQEGVSFAWTDDGAIMIGQTRLSPLRSTTGGYQNIDANGFQLLLNYRTLAQPNAIASQIPLSDLLKGQFDPAALTDRIVLIGTIAPSVGDYHVTPFSRTPKSVEQTPGVVLQAHMVSQLISAVLDDRPLLTTWPGGVELLWVLLWASVGGLIGSCWPGQWPGKSVWLTLGLGWLAAEGSLWGICWLLLVQASVWAPLVPAALALTLATLIARLQIGHGPQTGPD